MQIWTTFSPQKVTWEITTIRNKGKAGSSNWLKYKTIIDDSLKLLKKNGISGIRLVLFPPDFTKDGKQFTWEPLEEMLYLCKRHKMLVDLCIGPFQYPHYPGIYLPPVILKQVQHLQISRNKFGMTDLDGSPQIREYGLRFLRLQLERYGSDPRIRGFHLANEWPDQQAVSGNEQLRIGISKDFMIEAVTIFKHMTRKPISLNTNIDAGSTTKVFNTFKDIFAILEEQGKLGFDIYPSQESWSKTPLQKIQRLSKAYPTVFTKLCQAFQPCEMYFAEVEAQPWGNGQSWYMLIKNAPDPKEQVLAYSRTSLEETWIKHIQNTPCLTVSLWGSDFWLSAHEMGITWPITNITHLSSLSEAKRNRRVLSSPLLL